MELCELGCTAPGDPSCPRRPTWARSPVAGWRTRAVLVAAGTAACLTTDLFDRPDDAAQGLAVVVRLGALTAPAWLWGQVRPVRDNLGAAAGADGVGLLLALRGGAGGLWLVAGVLAAGTAVLGRAAFGSVPSVDPARLARESARAAQAQTYAVTGTLHHALDLYRPEPRGRTSALLRADGQLRGRLAQGAVHALRTPVPRCWSAAPR